MSIFKESLKTIALSLIILSLISIAYAWTEPTQTPPEGNTSAPINVSNTSQIKTGALQVNGFRNIGNTILDGNVGVGTTSPGAKFHVGGIAGTDGIMFPDGTIQTTAGGGGGGGVTSISSGTGVTLSPNPITATGTISVNTLTTQSRVSGTCPSGQAIRVVNQDGTVSCASMTTAATCTWGSKTYTTGAECDSRSSCTPPTGSYLTNTFRCKSDGAWLYLGNPYPRSICGC